MRAVESGLEQREQDAKNAADVQAEQQRARESELLKREAVLAEHTLATKQLEESLLVREQQLNAYAEGLATQQQELQEQQQLAAGPSASSLEPQTQQYLTDISLRTALHDAERRVAAANMLQRGAAHTLQTTVAVNTRQMASLRQKLKDLQQRLTSTLLICIVQVAPSVFLLDFECMMVYGV